MGVSFLVDTKMVVAFGFTSKPPKREVPPKTDPYDHMPQDSLSCNLTSFQQWKWTMVGLED